MMSGVILPKSSDYTYRSVGSGVWSAGGGRATRSSSWLPISWQYTVHVSRLLATLTPGVSRPVPGVAAAKLSHGECLLE